jgi:nitroreductase
MAATHAPDHGRLRPWRFILVRETARQRFGQILTDSLLRRMPGAEPAALEREYAKAFRAPLIVVVAARIDERSRIPGTEQLLAAGAAAENIMIASHALGFGAFWRTGDAAYDDGVKRALGLLSTDAIVGFLYIGTPMTLPEATPEPDPADFTQVLEA